MRFKIDENLPDALVALLREGGHDACTAASRRSTAGLTSMWQRPASKSGERS
jgi:hypothetical protein